MTSNNCAMFKVFLKTDDTTEIRKFVVDDASVITSFIFIKEKLQVLYPRLRDVNFRITWRDAEGDDITIENDEDLIVAFTEMEGQLKTLYITVQSPFQQQFQFGPSHYMPLPSHVVCDVCNNEITTYRYKCIQCFDYDLCGNCESAGHHSHHMMLRTSTPELPFSRCGRKVFEQVNKAVKKANHMAYRECKRKSKWEKKNKDSAEDASKEDQQTSGCPYAEYIPQFYPLIDAFSNIASNAANAAASAAASATAAAPPPTAASQPTAFAQPTASAQPAASAQSTPSEQKQDTNRDTANVATSQFVELIRNALSGVFVQPPQSQATTQPTNTQTQSVNTQSNPTPTAPNASPPNPQIDLTINSPDEPMEIAHREPGWTILSNEEHTSQPQYPVLTPTVAPNPVSQPQHPLLTSTVTPNHVSQPQHPFLTSTVAPNPVSQPQHPLLTSTVAPNPVFQLQHPFLTSTPNPVSQPQYPVLNPIVAPNPIPPQQQLDPKIALGLTQLLEMGFSDQQALITLLKRYHGNVDEVIKHIFENK